MLILQQRVKRGENLLSSLQISYAFLWFSCKGLKSQMYKGYGSTLDNGSASVRFASPMTAKGFTISKYFY